MQKSEYSAGSKILHSLALNSKAMQEISFDLEKSLYLAKTGKQPQPELSRPVFITGLARAGTTAILRHLYDTGRFASLSYQNMPFLLMPNLWSRMNGKQDFGYKERAHNDGIMVGADSPEAFDEVFWKTFLADDYVKASELRLNQIPERLGPAFISYLKLIILNCQKNGQPLRYLSKNNNNILRLDFLKKLFPHGSFIIPFRHPLQHAYSLRQQHFRFCDIQKEDAFSLKYFNWLGHHEFGLNHKPFNLGQDAIFTQMKSIPVQSINYWLLNWLNYYTYVLNNHLHTGRLVCYDDFCTDQHGELLSIADYVQADGAIAEVKPFKEKRYEAAEADEKIMKDCLEVYEALRLESKKKEHE